MAARVVIVGGGYGGAALAKALNGRLDVTLVEPKDAFVHAVAALRAAVSEPWAPRLFYRYEGLLTQGRHVRDRAVAVDAGGVTTANGTRIDADYVVLASGSHYPFPAKMDRDDTAEALARLAAVRDQLATARRVLLLGAGPVGIEFAGEISDQWPDKHITLLDPVPDLLGGAYAQALRDSLRDQLQARGVRLLLGASLPDEPPTPPGVAGPFTVTATTGEKIEADIWFRCHGVVPSTGYLHGDLAAARRADGHIEVDDRLRLPGQDTVFALGDITAIAESKRAAAAGRHAEVIAANILSLADGGTADATYQPGPAAILVPLGAQGGGGELYGPDGPTLLDAQAASSYKGADLMTGRYAEIFGTAPAPTGS